MFLEATGRTITVPEGANWRSRRVLLRGESSKFLLNKEKLDIIYRKPIRKPKLNA